MSLTYATYLKLDQLLSLQTPRTVPPEHDEHLFIIIHQTYELWFKLLLIEFKQINESFSANRLWEAVHTFKRVRTVMKTLVQQIDVVETMTPMSFTSFRDRLEHASGIQSVQFREIEFVLGFKRQEIIEYHPPESSARETLVKRLIERSMIDHFYNFLEHQGVTIPVQLRKRDVRKPTTGDANVQDSILRLYKTRPECSLLFELMVDFDEGLQEWRYRHIKLVERTIGSKSGTGFQGVTALKQSLFEPVFVDLWMIRNEL